MKRQLWVLEMLNPLVREHNGYDIDYGGWLPIETAYLTRHEARRECRDYNSRAFNPGGYRIRKYVPVD